MNPHDAFFKLVFGRPEHAASEFRAALPPDLVAQLDLDSLEDKSALLLGPDLTERTCDLLYEVQLKGEEALLYVLNEHQSTSTREALARFFFYAVRTLDRWTAREDNKGWKHLPPVICLLVYQGPGAWSAPTQVSELFGVPDAFEAAVRPYLPSFQILVDDLGVHSNADLRGRDAGALAKLCWLLLKNARTSPDFDQELRSWGDLLRGVADSERDLTSVASYTLYASSLTPDEVRETFKAVAGPRAEEAVVTAGEQLIAEGEARGVAKGERKIFLRLLNVRFPGQVTPEIERRVRNATDAQLVAWGERFTAKSLDAVFASD